MIDHLVGVLLLIRRWFWSDSSRIFTSLTCISSMNSPNPQWLWQIVRKCNLITCCCLVAKLWFCAVNGGDASRQQRETLNLSQSDSLFCSFVMKTIGGGGSWLPRYTEHVVLLKMNTVATNHWNAFFSSHASFLLMHGNKLLRLPTTTDCSNYIRTWNRFLTFTFSFICSLFVINVY